MYERAKYLPAGDQGLVVEFGNDISPELNNKVRSFAFALDCTGIPGLAEYIPTYRSILVIYDPMVWKFESLVTRLRELEGSLASMKLPQPRIYHIPVVYGGEFGPDLPFVCRYTGLTEEEVVEIHTTTKYLIYMLGFTPGFPYLGGMDDKIAAPRLDTPRTSIPAGSVGIAGRQTGIYPVESPGGWRIIGCTPIKLFQPFNKRPVLFNAGDYIRFFEVTPGEYRRIARAVEKGEYPVKVEDYIGGVG
ncbi:5-oxoprolinase subunit PxpB [Desulfoscipio geothermicus]|uniref:Sensor histidine kinase inhibitor, KipI family n=1 Tax=Desulfoscipio geothermicus DSM 3669 TaxID=1121426 RepID=A0A1I6E634_9FIRM|nr:5-oxoprolinase subunit PxpB [Desulfoscipio geothermicus]SFR13204.1 sensor histidine kinase inhibitor, KipI family [Desulfoscipio geothermicus DSM 3669]